MRFKPIVYEVCVFTLSSFGERKAKAGEYEEEDKREKETEQSVFLRI